MKVINSVSLLLIFLSAHQTLAVFSSAECGSSKRCVQFPSSCDPSSSECIFFSWTWNGSLFNMELSGGSGGNGQYAAVAFGQVDGMQDADMYYCTGTALESGVIAQNSRAPTQAPVLPSNVEATSAQTANGVGECTFTRGASVPRNISDGSTKDFDLTTGTYYILVARGNVNGSGAIQYHFRNKVISSNPVNMTAPASASTQPVTTAPAATTATSGPKSNDSACGVTKGCYQLPENCAEGSSGCAFFSWTYDSTANTFNMVITGSAGNGMEYVGVAFGLVNKMENADLYYCTGSTLVSSAITTFHAPPTNQDITAEPITITSSATSNGVARCEFTRAASITKPTTSGTNNYDLSTSTYYILLAMGPLSDDGSVQFHSLGESITSDPVNMTLTGTARSAGAHTLEKVHGGFMMTAWLLLANIGIAFARHFKPLYPEKQPFGVKVWFMLHRLIMVTVVLLTLAAFIMIFVHVGAWSTGANSHAIIGVIVMALAILNPILALFRPHPNTPKRPVFNIVHYLVGICARGLGTANLFLGVGAIGSMSDWSIPVLGGYVGFEVLMEIILEIASYYYGHSTYSKSKSNNEPPPSDSTLEMETNVRVRGQGVKTLLMTIYFLGLTAFLITFYVDISRA